MPTANKAVVLRRHAENTYLNTSAPPLMPRSARDLAGSRPWDRVVDPVVKAASGALHEGQTHYVDVPGIGPLRQALADYLQETYGAPYESGQVLITAGIQECRFLTLQKIGELYGNITIPAVVHPGVRRALGTRPLTLNELQVTEEHGYLPTLDAVREALEAGSRLVYLESPSRLTGKVYGAEEASALAEMLQAFDAGLVLDQGLAPWVPDAAYHSPAADDGATDRIAVLGEVWPGMGLDSWFIGYIASPEAWFEPMRSQKQIMAICTSTASQYAALEAGKSFAQQRTSQMRALAENRARAAELAYKAGLTPLAGEANSVIAVRCATGAKADIQEALQQAGYAVADGEGFGVADVLRLGVSTDETTLAALQSLS